MSGAVHCILTCCDVLLTPTCTILFVVVAKYHLTAITFSPIRRGLPFDDVNYREASDKELKLFRSLLCDLQSSQQRSNPPYCDLSPVHASRSLVSPKLFVAFRRMSDVYQSERRRQRWHSTAQTNYISDAINLTFQKGSTGKWNPCFFHHTIKSFYGCPVLFADCRLQTAECHFFDSKKKIIKTS